jgi:imidazolonepropionase-like amidohydrolase
MKSQHILSRRAAVGVMATTAATVLAGAASTSAAGADHRSRSRQRYVVAPDRVFDGTRLLDSHAVAIDGAEVAAVAPAVKLRGAGRRLRFPGTVMPGFIDLHAHLLFQGVPAREVLRHGVTTIRDLGGPLAAPSGGDGRLRVLTAGPMITAPGGYPVPVFGADNVAAEVSDVPMARALVRRIVHGGAALIKVSLEPGGSPGAPWTTGHEPSTPPPWPLLSPATVHAIVDEAHAAGRIVSAHLSGTSGAVLALDAGVDEWAHVPCDPLPDDVIARVVADGVQVVGTLDTQSHCAGVMLNARRLVEAGVRLLYGTDLAHSEIPWGIDAHELHLMLHSAGHGAVSALDVLSAATARAGTQLGLEPLGRLVVGAPADLIGVRADPDVQFKPLEYPELVISGGHVIVRPDEWRRRPPVALSVAGSGAPVRESRRIELAR